MRGTGGLPRPVPGSPYGSCPNTFCGGRALPVTESSPVPGPLHTRGSRLGTYNAFYVGLSRAARLADVRVVDLNAPEGDDSWRGRLRSLVPSVILSTYMRGGEEPYSDVRSQSWPPQTCLSVLWVSPRPEAGESG